MVRAKTRRQRQGPKETRVFESAAFLAGMIAAVTLAVLALLAQILR